MRLGSRPAQESDTDFARSVHHLALRDVVVRQFGEWNEAKQDAFFLDEWTSGPFEVILCNGEPCGYASIVEHAEHILVKELVILPQFQGRGIGTQILQDVFNRAREKNIPVKLGTLHANRAIELYRRLGFQDVGRTDTHTLFIWRDDGVAA